MSTPTMTIDQLPDRSIRVTAGGPTSSQTVKAFTGTISTAAGTSAALYTVSAGKTFIITDIVITYSNGTAGTILIGVAAAGTPIFQAHANTTKGIEAVGLETQPQGAAGQAMTVTYPTTVGGTIAYNIYGIEE